MINLNLPSNVDHTLRLVEDNFLQISSSLDAYSLGNCCRVSTRWHREFSSDGVWRTFFHMITIPADQHAKEYLNRYAIGSEKVFAERFILFSSQVILRNLKGKLEHHIRELSPTELNLEQLQALSIQNVREYKLSTELISDEAIAAEVALMVDDKVNGRLPPLPIFEDEIYCRLRSASNSAPTPPILEDEFSCELPFISNSEMDEKKTFTITLSHYKPVEPHLIGMTKISERCIFIKEISSDYLHDNHDQGFFCNIGMHMLQDQELYLTHMIAIQAFDNCYHDFLDLPRSSSGSCTIS